MARCRVCYDGVTGEVLRHRLGIHTPWHPHQQIALCALTLMVWIYFSTIVPAIDTTDTRDVAMLVAWCTLLGLIVAMIARISSSDPSDGVDLNEASNTTIDPVRFESVCFICQQVYASHDAKYRYHCRRCNKCTTRFDHHCTFLNQCIAGNNYTLFFSLVSVTLLWMGYTAAYSIYMIVQAHDSDSDIAASVARTWGTDLWTAMLCLLGFISLSGTVLLLMLWSLHLRFVIANWLHPDEFAGTFNYEYDDEEVMPCLLFLVCRSSLLTMC